MTLPGQIFNITFDVGLNNYSTRSIFYKEYLKSMRAYISCGRVSIMATFYILTYFNLISETLTHSAN